MSDRYYREEAEFDVVERYPGFYVFLFFCFCFLRGPLKGSLGYADVVCSLQSILVELGKHVRR